MEWKLVARPGVTALERFVADHEPDAVAVSERVRRGLFDKRLRSGGRCYYLPGEAAVYHGPGGFFAPIGLREVTDTVRLDGVLRSLRRATGTFTRLHSIMGNRHDVELMARAFDGVPRITIDYDLLALKWPAFPQVDRPPHPELRIVRPRPSQWRRLLHLQMAYEVEEVLLPGHRPNPSSSRASLAHSLETQHVLVATYRDEVVARVATNARGFLGDQIGGVYTVPEWRQRGVSRWLMTSLLADLRREERHASLFVKLDNTPARELYRSLGFVFESPFRISYYQ